ncbi:MAG: hypothetical protein AAGG38_03980 [Planctomycetota bacterium]
MDLAERYAFPTYLLRQKVFKLFGEDFHIFDPDGNVVLYSKQKAFKVKEDIRVYADESMAQEVLTIRTQSIFDISGTYGVVDPTTGETVGALKRHGFKSMIKDQWTLYDDRGEEAGQIIEDSTFKALVRRAHDIASALMPQAYHATWQGQPAAVFKQNFNPFVRKIAIDFTPDTGNRLDPRLGLAAAILLCAIEGKQN